MNFTMNALLESWLPDWLLAYVYPPFILITWVLVEWVRFQFEGIDKKLKPKHLTAIVGVVTGVLCYFLEIKIEGVVIEPFKLLISYLALTLLYEYAIKPIKEKFFPNFVHKQKDEPTNPPA